MAKSYLGDGVYCDFDGFGLLLTTEDGVRETNRIVLEPEVYNSLKEYVEQLMTPEPEVHQPECLCDECAGKEGTYAYNKIEEAKATFKDKLIHEQKQQKHKS